MRPLLILAVIALSFSTSLAQGINTPKQLLHDFRTDSALKPAKIPMATQRSVISKVFRKYLTDGNKCDPNFAGNGADDYLKAARNAGQIVPSIVDSTTGSFTASGLNQTAYVIFVSECNAAHVDNFGTDRIAIFNGDQLVANIDLDFKNSILAKTDLNGDGINELLMTSGYMNQGTLTESAALLSFQNNRLNVIQDFETVAEDSCASGFPGSAAKASVISYALTAPGSMPRFLRENYSASCRGNKRWKFLSTGKMPE